jgi:hypothetical protein
LKRRVEEGPSYGKERMGRYRFCRVNKKAQFYFGTIRLMHIASAVGIPVVGLFGGGTWPRFLPLGPHSIGVAGELSCFGCGWDCIFGDAPCMSIITVEDACKAIKTTLQDEAVESNVLRSSNKVNEETKQYIEKAVHRFKSTKSGLVHKLEVCEADRASLQEVIERQAKVLKRAVELEAAPSCFD